MGARLVTTFCDEHGDAVAHIYDHWAADNEACAEKKLQAFFDAVQADCEGTDTERFSDPSYLAAKFVVWRATGYAMSETLTFEPGTSKATYHPENVKPLNFLSVGIVPDEESYGPEHIVRVHPPKRGESRPHLEHVPAGWRKKRGEQPLYATT